MSAFIVSHDHIDAIVTYAAFSRVSFWNPEAKTRTEITMTNAEEIGRMLLHENERSVRGRYPDDGPGELPGTVGEDAATYRFRVWQRPLKPVEVIKAVKCLEYQSCEHRGWESSLAWRICQSVKDHAINRLPGYDDAAWEINRARQSV